MTQMKWICVARLAKDHDNKGYMTAGEESEEEYEHGGDYEPKGRQSRVKSGKALNPSCCLEMISTY